MICRFLGCLPPLLGSLVFLLSTFTLFATCTHGGNVYKIGYISQFIGDRGGSKLGLKISGALSYAAALINNSTELLGDDKLTIIHEDEKGDSLRATRIVVDMLKQNVSLIIGPENFCKYEAHVASAVGLPIFSYKCNDPTIRILETNLITLVPSEKYVVNMLIKLFQQFNWRKFTLIYEDGYMRPIRTQLRNFVDSGKGAEFTMREVVYVNPGSPLCDMHAKLCGNQVMHDIIRSTKDTTRIYVIMGNVSNLSRFGFALAAMGLTQRNEYKVIYISTELFIDDFNELLHHGGSPYTTWYKYGQNIGMQHVLAIVPRAPKGAIQNGEFENIVRTYSQEPPFNLTSPPTLGDKKISIFAYYLFDTLMTWARAVTEIRKLNKNWRDGSVVAGHIRNTTVIPSLTGINLTLEKDGHVVGEYELLSFDFPKLPRKKVGKFNVVGRFSVHNQTVNLTLLTDLFEGEIILDEPVCGFDGAKCPSEKEMIRKWVLTILSFLLLVVLLSVSIIYQYWRYEQEIAGLLWKINPRDLTAHKGGAISAVSKMSLASQGSCNSLGRIPSADLTVLNHKGTLVVIKKLMMSRKGAGNIPRKLMKEMKIMKGLLHHNVNPFIGAYVNESNHIFPCTEYCTKGSLQDVLEDEIFKLDTMFIAALVMDLVRGIEYIHQSAIRVHGNLKSKNCLITNKWTLRLSNFGFGELRFFTDESGVLTTDKMQYYKSLLWRSPQELRSRALGEYVPATPKDDIYSFAIIMHEIMSRKGVWGSVDMDPEEIVATVRALPAKDRVLFRPPLDDIQCQDYIVKAITDGWAESPEDRPDITSIASRLKKIRQGMKTNIMDHMVNMLEKYSNNLEETVCQRTQELVEEKKKTETLLHRMLPRSVAVQLIGGKHVEPESFDAVTIYFSDIVGFTEMSSQSTPMEVVSFLNDLYTLFDSIIRNYNVYKVETIGDAYMVVSGLPERNGNKHASEIALMALELLDAIKTFRITHRPDQQLKLRIGLHTGPVVAGVVGLTMPRYCLFGDTVNTASRMESTGEALKVHISSQTKDVLKSLGGFVLECRGFVNMKGKGEQLTYWLKGYSDGPSRRRKHYAVPVTPLFNGPLQDGRESRRSSLIPLVSSMSNMVDYSPNGGPNQGVQSGLLTNTFLANKRPSQAKLPQPKHSTTPPFSINIGNAATEGTHKSCLQADEAGISFAAKEPSVAFAVDGPTKIRRNGSKFSSRANDSLAPLLPRYIARAKFENNFGKRSHSLDNELSQVSSRPSGRLKSVVQKNYTQRDRDSVL